MVPLPPKVTLAPTCDASGPSRALYSPHGPFTRSVIATLGAEPIERIRDWRILPFSSRWPRSFSVSRVWHKLISMATRLLGQVRGFQQATGACPKGSNRSGLRCTPFSSCVRELKRPISPFQIRFRQLFSQLGGLPMWTSSLAAAIVPWHLRRKMDILQWVGAVGKTRFLFFVPLSPIGRCRNSHTRVWRVSWLG